MATTKEIDDFKLKLETIVSFDEDTILSNPDWGTIDFTAGKPDCERLFTLARQYQNMPLNLLPDGILTQITPHAEPIINTLERIVNFRIEDTSNPSQIRTEILSNLKSNVDNFFKLSFQYLPYLAYQRGDVDRNLRQLSKTITAAEDEARDAKEAISKLEQEARTIVETARELSVTVGVAHFSNDFNDESISNATTSKFWLTATAISASATLISSILLGGLAIWYDYPQERVFAVISSKILIITILISTTLWCGKLYKASQHLYTVNKQRAHALRTFQAFYQSTDDEPTKNAVLLETTRSIFAITPSGYIDAQDQQNDGSLKILEVIKNIAPKP